MVVPNKKKVGQVYFQNGLEKRFRRMYRIITCVDSQSLEKYDALTMISIHAARSAAEDTNLRLSDLYSL